MLPTVGWLTLLAATASGAETESVVSPSPAGSRPAVTVTAPFIPPIDPRRSRPLALLSAKTGARLEVPLFTGTGELRPEALGSLRSFLGTAEGETHPVHWRLATLLVAVSEHFRGRPLVVVSGYRTSSEHAARSNHTRGRALDFRVTGVPNRVLYEALRRSFAGVGVGYYPNSTFVHLDVRESDATWIDYAGPNDPACYSRRVQHDLATGDADRLSLEEAQRAGCRQRARATGRETP